MARGKHSKKTTKTTTATETVAAAPAAPAPAVVLAAVPAVAAVKPAPAPTATVARKIVVSREAIAQRAFELFRARGSRHGNAMQDWLQAEAELNLGKQ